MSDMCWEQSYGNTLTCCFRASESGRYWAPPPTAQLDLWPSDSVRSERRERRERMERSERGERRKRSERSEEEEQ